MRMFKKSRWMRLRTLSVVVTLVAYMQCIMMLPVYAAGDVTLSVDNDTSASGGSGLGYGAELTSGEAESDNANPGIQVYFRDKGTEEKAGQVNTFDLGAMTGNYSVGYGFFHAQLIDRSTNYADFSTTFTKDMIIRKTDGSHFSLKEIKYFQEGGPMDLIVEGYLSGIKQGEKIYPVDVAPAAHIKHPYADTPTAFSNIDEVHITGKNYNGSSDYDYVLDSGFLLFNSITVGDPILPDTTAPTLQSAVRDSNTQITVALGEASQNLTKANDSGFTVYEKGNPGKTYAVTATAQGTDNSHVVLTVANLGVSAEEGLTVIYTAGANGTIQDLAGNALATDTTGVTIPLWDSTAPTVSSINRQTPAGASTNATSVVYRVTFDEAVTGVDTSDFTLTATGTATGTIASVSASSGTTMDVTVNGITGVGTLRLDLKDSGTGIQDIGGTAIATGYANGQPYTVENAAPTATVQAITGTLQVGETLTGHYTYSDVNEDLQGTSTYKWYRSDDVSGLNKSVIAGATSLNYVLQSADTGKYISFEVTPVAATGIAQGTAAESEKVGAIVGDTTAPSGYSVAIDQAAINNVNQADMSFTFNGAEVGATYNYTVSSSGGAGTITGSGTIASAGQQITGINTSSLSDGTLTLSATLTDAAGNTGAAETDTVSKDTEAAPTINTQPSDATVGAGNNASFTASATGTGLTYQWQVNTGAGFSNITNGGVYSGATTATLNITGATAGMNGYQYRVVVTGAGAMTTNSDSATLTVNAPPSINIQPSNATVEAGNNTSFTVAAAGTGLTYQWQVNTGAGFSNITNGGVYSGATTATLNITGATAGMNGYQYQVMVTGAGATTTNSNSATLTVNAPPSINIQPSNATVEAGNNTSFTVAAAGTGLTYQWQVNTGAGFSNITNGGVYSGATTATLNITGATAGMNGYQYRVAVTGAGAMMTNSNSATLTVNAPPTATVQAITGTLQVGATLTGHYTYNDVNGDLQGTSTYKWYRSDDASGLNKSVIAGATSLTYVLQAADTGKYISFEVTPVAATGITQGTAVESAKAGAVVLDEVAPAATVQAITGTLQVGETLTGHYTYSDVNGDIEGTSTYKWYRSDDASGLNKTVIAGATSLNYVLQSADTGKYISFEVTPVAATGITQGIAVEIAKAGVVVPAEAAPTAMVQAITGTLQVGATLTGHYTYNDVNGDLQGTSTYKWYRSDDASGLNKSVIAGATSLTYVLQAADTGKYISFEVTPVAATGIAQGTVVESAKSGPVTPASSGGSGGSGGGSSSTTTTQPSQNTIVIVNGKSENAGTEKKSTEAGKSTVTVEVNNKVIESKIDEAVKSNTTGSDNVIQVPVSDTSSDVAKVELTGDIVKKLEEHTFDVSIKRENVEYVIPAEELTISSVAKELGVVEQSLKDIKVEVLIKKLDTSIVAKYNEVAKANGAELVFPPVAFEIVAKTTKADGTKSNVEIEKFSNYVERVMQIPAEVDPSKVTTGIVFNPDGTYSHVPTVVYQKDGKWYAKLNSLTNSNYSVVWNPITVKSVANHWSKVAVNDMASRLVIFNPQSFDPNKAITRADFAEYIVRALGLYREGSSHENKFKDVNTKGDRTQAILIANEYGIVTGYPDGTFRPDSQITREEAMTMYARAMKVTKLVGTDQNRYQNYTDYSQVGSWATSYLKEVLSAHVFNGTTATTIAPKSNLTYAEATQAIKNLLVESKLINK